MARFVPPDPPPEPPGYVVVVAPGDRIHFLDWGGDGAPGVVLVHGLATSAWVWAPVARRLIAARRAFAMDLRGHGLSDAPTDDGAYDLDVLAGDVIAVAEGSGALDPDDPVGRVVLVGHGFGAIAAATAAVELGEQCALLVLVDGGLEHLPTATGMDVDEFLRGLDEPPEVMRSMAAYLADRRGWDPASWDDDQERAARAAVVETPAGRLVPATRPHALEATVRSMFSYEPDAVLRRVAAPIVVVRRTSEGGESAGPEPPLSVDAVVVEVDAPGHNLLRYRPDEITAAILGR
ncbi:MAG TPA: alpha/beta fold hydrolase [Candidatus Limnocylindrales bacterium]|nr:alpha/beta fold hydrolase [Candidatus Limnocylindrales bacterium]